MPVKPKKKVKRKKSGALQKQKQTQIVTVNVAVPARKRRRTKKPASGAGAGAPPPPPPQGFAQVIYPVVNSLQRDTQFNLAGIQAQLKTLQDRAVGGVPLGAMPTQTQVQLGEESIQSMPIGDPEDIFFDPIDTTPVVRVASPELPREAPTISPFKPISAPPEDTPFKPISAPPEDLPKKLKKKLILVEDLFSTEPMPPSRKRGAPKLTDIEKQERAERRELIRQESLTTPVTGRPVPDFDKLSFRPTITYGATPTTESKAKTVQPTIEEFFRLQGETY